MPLFQMIALAVSASTAVPAEALRTANAAPGMRCELVQEASAETAGRTRKTYLSRCPGLRSTRLNVSYEQARPATPPSVRPR